MSDLKLKYQDILNGLQEPDMDSRSINDRILLIDGMNNFIRSFAANNTMDFNGNLIGGVVGFLKTIGYSIKFLNPTRVFIVFDGKNGNSVRRKIYPEYKSNRNVSHKYNRFYHGSKNDENLNMKWQTMILMQLLDFLPVTVLSIDNYEGDDVISFISNNYKNESEKIYINSTDKDFLQLVDDNVFVWNPMKKKLYDRQSVLEEYGINSSNFIIYKSITGDNSDNISGIKGVGGKTISNKFTILSEKNNVSTNEFMEYCTEHYNESQKFKKIVDNKDVFIRNKQLMDLTNNDIISSTIKYKIKDIIDSDSTNELSKNEFIKTMNNYYLLDSFNNIDYWLSSVFYGLSSFSK